MAKIIHLFLISMVIVAGLNANNTVAKEKKMNILKNKPVYQLSIKAFGAKYFIEVNGKTVFQELFFDGKTITTVPINHWMRSGNNIIGIYVFSEKPGVDIGSNANAKISLIGCRTHAEHKTNHLACIFYRI